MLVTTNLVKIQIDRILLDRGTQCRDLSTPDLLLRHRLVRDTFAAQMVAGEWAFDRSPPILFGPVEIDGYIWYIPGDGHTRIAAAKIAQKTSILCELRGGRYRDAVLYSIGPANKQYLSCLLTDADLVKRVELALKDRELWGWIDKRIAVYCDDSSKRVDRWLVRKLRLEYLDSIQQSDPHEFEWRTQQMQMLRAIDKNNGEYIARRPKSNGRHLASDGSISLNVIRDLPHAAHTIARIRAAESDVPLADWIGATILGVDAVLIDRDKLKVENALLRQQLSRPRSEGTVQSPDEVYLDRPRYIYTGGAAEYDILGVNPIGTFVATDGAVFELVDILDLLGSDDPRLSVRPISRNWLPQQYALISLDCLKWLR